MQLNLYGQTHSYQIGSLHAAHSHLTVMHKHRALHFISRETASTKIKHETHFAF